LIIEIRGNPRWVENVVDIINEGLSNNKFTEFLEEI
jgi:hypothetical protein